MPRSAPPLARWVAAVLVVLAAAGPASAVGDVLKLRSRNKVHDLNKAIGGRLLDFTDNHDCDRRLYSPTLGTKRDLYVYLPPGYDGRTQFPAMLWLHGFGYDEKSFLNVVPRIDEAVRSGKLPPMVVAAPDGSISGNPSPFNAGSFYLAGKHGDYEGYVARDVWEFVKANFCVRPEREAHVIGGASMGGFGAFNLAFKHREEFGHIVGVMPPVNLRYGDGRGKYLTPYDPNDTILRETDRRNEVIGRFYGVLLIRARRMTDPVIGRHHPDPTGFIAAENPMEMLACYDVKACEFGMFIGYGTMDEFNINAQVESFLDTAAARGIRPCVVVIPGGRHSVKTAIEMFPDFCRWMSGQLAPYVPPGYVPPPGPNVPPRAALRRLPVLGWLPRP